MVQIHYKLNTVLVLFFFFFCVEGKEFVVDDAGWCCVGWWTIVGLQVPFTGMLCRFAPLIIFNYVLVAVVITVVSVFHQRDMVCHHFIFASGLFSFYVIFFFFFFFFDSLLMFCGLQTNLKIKQQQKKEGKNDRSSV